MGKKLSTMTREAPVDRQMKACNEEWHIRSSYVFNSPSCKLAVIEIFNEQLVMEKGASDEVQLKENDEESHDKSPDGTNSSLAKRGNTLRSDANLSISEDIVVITTPLQQDDAPSKKAWKTDPPCVLEKPLSVTHQFKLNPGVKEFIPRLKNRPSLSADNEDKNHNVEQTRETSDRDNTASTSDLTVSLNTNVNSVIPRSDDAILPRVLEKPLSNTSQFKLNPGAKEFTPGQKNRSSLSADDEDKNLNVEQTHETSDPDNTASTSDLTVSLNTNVNSVTPRSDDTILPCVHEKPLSNTSQFKLNPGAKEFTPGQKNRSSLSADDEDKNLNVEQTHETSDPDNTASTSDLTVLLSTNVNSVTPRSDDTILPCVLDTPQNATNQFKLNPGAKEFTQGLKNRPSLSTADEDKNHYVEQTHETSDRDNTASTSDLTVSLNTNVNSVTPRSDDTILPCVHEKSLSDTNQFKLNPGAKEFTPGQKNRSSLSADDEDKNHNVEQTRETSDPDNTASTSDMTGSLSTSVNSVTPRSENIILPCVLEKPQSVTNQFTLNPGAKEFTPGLKNRSSLSVDDGDKNLNVEQTHETSDPDNTASTSDMTGSLSTSVNSVTQRPEGTIPQYVEECISTVTPKSQDTLPQHLEECISTGTPRSDDTLPQYLEECISTVTPRSENTIPQQLEECISTVTSSSKDTIPQYVEECISTVAECNAQTACPPEQESTNIKNHLQPVESGILPHMACSNKLSVFDPLSVDTSYEYMLDGLEFRVSGDNYFSGGNVLNQDAAHASQEMLNIHSTTSAPAFVGFSDQLPSKVDLPNGNFCRTPGCKCHNGLRCHGENLNAQSEIDGTDPKVQQEEMNILSEVWYLENDDFLDRQNQQAAAWAPWMSLKCMEQQMGHNQLVINENGRDVTDPSPRAATAGRSAGKWNMNVSSWAIDLERRKIREQLYMMELHRAMGGDNAQSVDMQMQMVNMLKGVSLSIIDLKMLEADHQVRQLNSIPSTLTTREMENTHEALRFYMTDCNILKITVEIFALDLVEQVMDGSSVDWSSIDLQAPSFHYFLSSYTDMTHFQAGHCF